MSVNAKASPWSAEREIAVSYEQKTGIPAVDSLAGLYRFSVFRLILEDVWERRKSAKNGFSLVLVDVDRFDRINQLAGLVEGDLTLRRVATAAKESLRDDDVAGHLGGGRFGLLLWNTDPVAARKVVLRIQSRIVAAAGADATVSAGITGSSGYGTSIDEMFSNAKTTLTRAKLRGRDRIAVFEANEFLSREESYTILIVDDDDRNRKLLRAFLDDPLYTIVECDSASDALRTVSATDIDLILSDVRMPDMDGYELCRQMKSMSATRLIPFVLLTAHTETEQKVKGIEAGADDFLTKPLDTSELIARTRSLLRVRKMSREYVTVENVLFTLINAIEAKDTYTQGHTERVAAMAVEVGRRLDLSRESLDQLRTGGLLHDIGKIGVPASVLNKSGPLSDDEWTLIRSHTELGYRICSPLKATLGRALEIIRHHHEKLDGSSYPDGISAASLPIEVRIMTVVDMYDAMTTTRPYRTAMRPARAFEILWNESGAGKIDGEVVHHLEAFVNSHVPPVRRSADGSTDDIKTILVVEDDPLNLKLVQAVLRLEGFRVVTASDAETGIRTARDLLPDMILMDIKLPGMNGIEAMEVIQADEGLNTIPVIALSSYAMISDIQTGMEAGFADYVTKPIDTATLPRALAQHLRLRT